MVKTSTVTDRAGRFTVGSFINAADPEDARTGPGPYPGIDMIPGIYNGYVNITREGGSEPFVSSLVIKKDSEPEWDGTPNGFSVFIGTVNSHSGAAGFFTDGFMLLDEELETFYKNMETRGDKFVLTKNSFIAGCAAGEYPIYARLYGPDMAAGLMILFN